MIRDFTDFADGAVVNADIGIIGSGAAGIAIAREFIGTRHRVLLLESGGLRPERDAQSLYDSKVVGLPHTGVHEGRVRVFGGTTTLWGGQALRLDAFDMEKRGWVPHSGWPISRASLEPYYERAATVMNLGPRATYGSLCSAFRVSPPAFDPDKLYMECSQWSPKPNFGTAYRDQLKNAGNIEVLLHANVTCIVTDPAGETVQHVEFSSLSGKKGTAKARFYVICCGGIETARLLLASDRVQRHGVGNDHDLVGRYFQEHIHIRYGELVCRDRSRLQDLFESFYRNGLKYFPVVALSPQFQTAKRLLSIHGSLGFEDLEDSGVAALKQVYKIAVRKTLAKPGEFRTSLINTLRRPTDLFRVGYRFYVGKRSATPSTGVISIGAQAEVSPNPESRVLLDDSRDSLGMRRTKLDWRIGEQERKTLTEFIKVLAAECDRIGLGSFSLKQVDVLDDPESWVTMIHDSSHHMGTTRMHASPQSGVVDPNCRVHGVDNLYIGSSSVFPTCARSNPTLTIIALSLRIADRLRESLN